MRNKIILLSVILLTLSGCAQEVTLEAAIEMEKVGFWYGLWHGFIFSFAWFISLFTDASIYATYNNGGWYNFGYFLGVAVFGVGASSTNK